MKQWVTIVCSFPANSFSLTRSSPCPLLFLFRLCELTWAKEGTDRRTSRPTGSTFEELSRMRSEAACAFSSSDSINSFRVDRAEVRCSRLRAKTYRWPWSAPEYWVRIDFFLLLLFPFVHEARASRVPAVFLCTRCGATLSLTFTRFYCIRSELSKFCFETKIMDRVPLFWYQPYRLGTNVVEIEWEQPISQTVMIISPNVFNPF